MTTYVALLRGINVGGKHRVKMADLKLLLEECGYSDIQTYIQSGNAVFRSSTTTAERAQRDIEQALQERYGFPVPTVVRTSAEMLALVQNNPFAHHAEAAPKALHIAFLDAVPAPDAVEALAARNYSPEEYALEGKHVYLLLPDGYSDVVLQNGFLEKKLRVRATTRNWNTTCIVAEMAEQGRRRM